MARGNVYIGAGYGHSKRAKLNVTLATWNTDVMAVQNGTEIYQGSTALTQYDIIKKDVAGKYVTKFTAVGAVGAEIGFIYAMNPDGTNGKKYTQATTAVTGTFSYAPATKEITFFAGDITDADAMFACSYTFKSATNAQKISISGSKIPKVVLLTAYGLVTDICTGQLFQCQIEGQVQVDGNWNFDLSADGEPAVQNLALEFVKGCLADDLYTITIYTDDETAPTTP